jgi:hypothetical protein
VINKEHSTNQPINQLNPMNQFILESENNCYIGDNDSIWLTTKQIQQLTEYESRVVSDFCASREFEACNFGRVVLYPFYVAGLLVESQV